VPAVRGLHAAVPRARGRGGARSLRLPRGVSPSSARVWRGRPRGGYGFIGRLQVNHYQYVGYGRTDERAEIGGNPRLRGKSES
jgi:hypothetical protein